MREVKPALWIHSAGYKVHEGVHEWDRGRALEDFDLVVALAGRGYFDWGGEGAWLNTGDCILCQKGRHYKQTTGPEDLMTEVYIHFDWKSGPGGLPVGLVRSLPHVVHGIEDMGFFRTLVLRVVEAHHQRGAEDRAVAWLRAALEELARQGDRGEIAGPRREREASIRRVAMEVLENVAHPWRVEEMARRAGVSADHFRRLFRHANGISAGEYILNSRMEAARQQLRHSSLSVGEIADSLGFSDISSFSRIFKTRVGVSPSAFRGKAPTQGTKK
jgi:AraC family transcriptional regulator, arabinose operon regulatory protein